jgi:hypothetical protein
VGWAMGTQEKPGWDRVFMLNIMSLIAGLYLVYGIST